ncbi:MAG: hypothetical protein WCA37_02165 [Terracidiphilus sp.]
MKPSTSDRFAHSIASVAEAEAALGRIASLPAPEGLEDRIKAALEAAPSSGTVLAWPLAAQTRKRHEMNEWLRGAAAAAIVAVVAGGGWGIYTHTQPAKAPSATVMPPRISTPGGFSSAGAMRTPQTLVAPKVNPASSGAQKPVTTPGSDPSKQGKAPHKGKARPAEKASRLH